MADTERRARGGQDPGPYHRRDGCYCLTDLIVCGAIGEVMLLHGFPAAQ